MLGMSALVLRHQTGDPFRGHAGDQTALLRVWNQLGSPSDEPTIADFEFVRFSLRHDLEGRVVVIAIPWVRSGYSVNGASGNSDWIASTSRSPID